AQKEPASDVSDKIEQIREEIAKDPQSVFKYITISPVKKDDLYLENLTGRIIFCNLVPRFCRSCIVTNR
ncbi:hypothetical protein BTO03_01670, partial [Vibrio parahaemolyticus]